MRPLLATLAVVGALAMIGVAAADEGYTTWYGPGFHGNVTYYGERFDEQAFTTASNQLPHNTWIRVTNPHNGKSVTVRVNDRGGFTHALDLSRAAFFALDPPNNWGFTVRYEVVPGPDATPVPKPSSTPAPAPAVRSEPARPAPSARAPSRSEGDEYVVARGDTLRAIATRFGLTVPVLIDLNELANPNLIGVGQKLRLSAAPPPPLRAYTVKPGDTLRGIARSLDVDLHGLIALNDLTNPNMLVPGQELRLP